MNLRRALLEHWPYKVAAIVLSVLLWLNVTADRERQGQRVRTPLEFEVRDSAWSLRSAPDEVWTVFQGRRGDLIALFNEPVIRKVIDDVRDSTMEVELSVNDVAFDRRLTVRPTAVDPSRVTVRLERRISKRVPVRARAGARAAEGFALGRTQVEPESVTVRGPESQVAGLTGVSTEPLQVGQIRRSVSQQLALRPSADLPGVTVEPENVMVMIEVDSILSRDFRVPVSAIGAGSGSVALEPGTVRVRVTGPAGAVRSLATGDLGATVRVDAPLGAPRTFPVQVELPADVNATLSTEPPRVTARPRGEEGPRQPE